MPEKLKITDIKVFPIDNYLFVQIHTDAGITGLGESGAWGYLEASGTVIESFKGYLIGQDAPGIGVELAEDAQKRFPFKPRGFNTRLNTDGSVMDQ